MSLEDCIPKDKFDVAAIVRANQICLLALSPFQAELLKWVQDPNWPVAPSTAALLSRFDVELLPHVKSILRSEDALWKHTLIDLVVRNLSTHVVHELNADLARLAVQPTPDEKIEEVDVVARDILKLFKY